MSREHRGIVAVCVAVAVVGGMLAACGADPDMQDAMAPGGVAADKTEVVALDNVFGEDGADVKVPVGGTVEWVNQGRNDHDIVPVDGPEGFGVEGADFRPGHTYDETFEKEGVYRYYCSLHGNKSGGMTGRIIVGDAEPPDEEQALDADAPAEVSGRTIAVPEDQPTIQKAVDAAGPGDLILVSPGTYEEAVQVPATKPYLTIRGLDRSKTILDGGFERANGVQVVKAKGVAVENLTLRNYTKNGVFWTGADGLPRLLPHRRPQRGLRRLRLRVDEGPDRPLLRVGQPRRRLLHRRVPALRRGDHRRGLGVERARLLRHQLGRQPRDRELHLAPQPGRHRAQQRVVRARTPPSATTRSSATSSTTTTTARPRPSTSPSPPWATGSSSPAVRTT